VVESLPRTGPRPPDGRVRAAACQPDALRPPSWLGISYKSGELAQATTAGCNANALCQPAPQRPHVWPGGRGRGCSRARGRKPRRQSSECFMSGYLRLLVRRGARFCHGRRSRARKSTRCLDAHNSTISLARLFAWPVLSRQKPMPPCKCGHQHSAC
jgi:hypothetical protein